MKIVSLARARETCRRFHQTLVGSRIVSVSKARGEWNTKTHLVAADARTAITFGLSPGQAHGAPEGRRLVQSLGPAIRPVHLHMDCAYERNETRHLALDLGFIPVVSTLKTRTQPWEYDRAMYKRRNEVERLFRRLKGYRRIFSRFDKLDVMFLGFISFTLVADGLRLCNRPNLQPNESISHDCFISSTIHEVFRTFYD